MILKVVDLILACESLVTYGSYDLYLRSKDLKHDVEAHLVVAGRSTAVSYVACAKLLYMLQHLESLEYSL